MKIVRSIDPRYDGGAMSADSVSTVFSKGIFCVPDYQRPYSWGKEEVTDFFNDLKDYMEDDKNSGYLFGMIIVYNRGNENEPLFDIIDGQQRIATSTIFLCVLRDILAESCTEPAKLMTISNSIISAISKDYEYRFIANGHNRVFFRDYVQAGKHDCKSDLLNRKVRDAYVTLHRLVKEYIGNRDVSDVIQKMKNAFLDGFKISFVETKEEKTAFVFFERLNVRGKKLKAVDLLKNLLFSKLKSIDSTYKDKWSEMYKKVIGAGGNPDDYIRFCWNSCHSLTTANNLYDEVSKLGYSELLEFCTYIFDNTDTYCSLVKKNYTEQVFNASCKRHIDNLRVIGATTFYPLVLAVKSKDIEDKNLLQLSKTIECLVVRNMVIAQYRGSRYEKFFSKLANEYLKGSPLSDIINSIKSATLGDDDITENMFGAFSPNSSLAKMMLVHINNCNHPELTVLDDGKEIHLEHIMPQDIGEWPVPIDEWKVYHKRFGNMILLRGKSNTGIKNALYDVKRKEYAKSEIDLTRLINEQYDHWDKGTIEERQKDLRLEVLKAWSNDR